MIRRSRMVGMRQLLVLSCLLLPSVASAQEASGIAGVVKDVSGAVLPGVAVEAASPALIEKVRSVVTDGEGRYSIVDLRPGTYVVTFSLTGFNTFKREGIALTAAFTATVNADMQVGALEETITVTGASSLVDTQNIRQQKVMYDGMNILAANGTSNGYLPNPEFAEEQTVETGGISAESGGSGVVMNMIPKTGSNTFAYGASLVGTRTGLQSDNLTDNLRGLGLTA